MRPARAWNAFWFGPISARPLGAFRIAYGLAALLNLGLLSLEMTYWFTDHGLLRGTEARDGAGALRHSLLNYVQDPTSVRLFFLADAAVIVLFTLGWHTRVMSILLYLATLSLHHRNIVSASGADVWLVILAFYLMLSPCGAAYSLDARRAARRRGVPAEPLIVPWAQRLVQVHLALIYLNTALLKAGGATWQNGTALHYVLNNAEVGRFSLGLPQFPLVINLMTYVALLFELSFPFLVWFRAARPWVLLGGLGLHGAILLTVNIPIFGELMTACYLTFLTPPELDTFLARIDPRAWLRRRRPATAHVPPAIPGRVDGPEALKGPHVLDYDYVTDPLVEVDA